MVSLGPGGVAAGAVRSWESRHDHFSHTEASAGGWLDVIAKLVRQRTVMREEVVPGQLKQIDLRSGS